MPVRNHPPSVESQCPPQYKHDSASGDCTPLQILVPLFAPAQMHSGASEAVGHRARLALPASSLSLASEVIAHRMTSSPVRESLASEVLHATMHQAACCGHRIRVALAS